MKFYYYVCEGWTDTGAHVKHADVCRVRAYNKKDRGFDIYWARRTAIEGFAEKGHSIQSLVVTFWKELTPQEYRMYRG